MIFPFNNMRQSRHSAGDELIAASRGSISTFLETTSPGRSRRNTPDRALAGDCARVSGRLGPGRHPDGSHRAGPFLGGVWTVRVLSGQWNSDPDAATAAAAVDCVVSVAGPRRRRVVAGGDLDFRGRTTQSILSVFCFRSGGGGLPLGTLGNAGHGGGRSRAAVGGEFRVARVFRCSRAEDCPGVCWPDCG